MAVNSGKPTGIFTATSHGGIALLTVNLAIETYKETKCHQTRAKIHMVLSR